MRRLTLRKLESWHKRLSHAHRIACRVSAEAGSVFGDDDDDAIVISDPIIELHAALCRIEGHIEALNPKDTPSHDD